MKIKDSALTGFIAGIIGPAAVFTIVFFAHRFYMQSTGNSLVTHEHKWAMFSLIPNLIFMRIFLKNQKYPASGKSILILTLLEVAAYFAFFGFDQ